MSPIKMAKIEIALRVVLAFKDAFNHHDVPGMLALMRADCRLETSEPAPDGMELMGKELIGKYWEAYFQARPQVSLKAEEAFSAGTGNRCVLRWRMAWVDQAGQQRQARGADIFLVRDGLICEQLSYMKG